MILADFSSIPFPQLVVRVEPGCVQVLHHTIFVIGESGPLFAPDCYSHFGFVAPRPGTRQGTTHAFCSPLFTSVCRHSPHCRRLYHTPTSTCKVNVTITTRALYSKHNANAADDCARALNKADANANVHGTSDCGCLQ